MYIKIGIFLPMKVISTKNLDINEVIKYFEQDVVVIPTETVYGLAASINNEQALKNIFRLKKRPIDNPLIVHVSSLDMLRTIIEGEVPENYQKIIEIFWPGPISLLFRANNNLSKNVTAGLNTVLVRMPDNKVVLDIIEKLNVPLAAPSANVSGKPSPTCVQHAIDDFGDNCPLYLDGGECKVGLESTVFSYINEPIILRPGGVKICELENIICKKINVNYLSFTGKNTTICPGQKYKHYSPINKFIVITTDTINLKELIKNYKNVGILSHFNFKPQIENVTIFELGNNYKEVATNFFKGLRKLDTTCDIIITKSLPLEYEGMAIMDRMKKAAHQILE